ncbi:MAG: hypothetical protein ACYC9R_13045 [Nitrosotalea sp.]
MKKGKGKESKPVFSEAQISAARQALGITSGKLRLDVGEPDPTWATCMIWRSLKVGLDALYPSNTQGPPENASEALARVDSPVDWLDFAKICNQYQSVTEAIAVR